MTDIATDTVHERIERALARIEAAAQRQASAQRKLADRHAALRSRIEAAITALDSEIARTAPDEEVA